MERSSASRARRSLVAVLALAVLAVPLLAAGLESSGTRSTVAAVVHGVAPPTAPDPVDRYTGGPAPTPPPAALAEQVSPAGSEPPPEPGAETRLASPPATRPSFAERFPAQAMASQDPRVPASTHWAVLVGINTHSSLVPDNIGSRQDAEDIRAHLLASGWRDDHILLLTDGAATRENIIDGLAWLAERSDPSSTVVFHYSGHSKVWYGEDVDGDGEVTDEGLWPADDRYITDAELVALLDPVDAGRAWLSFGTCNAAGFADAGLARPGRVVTFSSGELQSSYEHPDWGNSVWVFLMVEEGMRARVADLDGDGRVTVEEAWAHARPRARQETESQPDGPQDAEIADQLDGDLDLTVPGARPPAAFPTSRPAPPPPAAPAPPPRRDDIERHGGYLCLLCR